MNIKVNKTTKDLNLVVYEVLVGDTKVAILNLGATIYQLGRTNRADIFENIVLTYKKVEDYLTNPMYIGTSIGRVGGRIAQGKFELNGQTYHLDQNQGDNCLHGGKVGLHKKIFDIAYQITTSQVTVTCTTLLTEAEDHFPGNLEVKVVYVVKEGDLTIDFHATSTADTLCNLTNHSYFNLTGNLQGDIRQHHLQAPIRNLWFLDELNNPAKAAKPSSPFDLSVGKTVSEILESPDAQIRRFGGLDHPFEFEKGVKLELQDPTSKWNLKISATYPCVVLYSHNHENPVPLLGKKEHGTHMGLAIEPQFLPNDINITGSQSPTILKAGTPYHETIHYRFTKHE